MPQTVQLSEAPDYIGARRITVNTRTTFILFYSCLAD